MKSYHSFAKNWYFIMRNGPLEELNLPEKGEFTQKITLPHDWIVADTDLYEKSSHGYYYREFDVNCIEQILYLYFEGVTQDCHIFINGRCACTWQNGYTSFIVPLSGFIKKGVNEIVVACNYCLPNSRWYTGAGIYRNVWLIQKEATHFLPQECYVNNVKEAEEFWKTTVSGRIQSKEGSKRIGIDWKLTSTDIQEMVAEGTVKEIGKDGCFLFAFPVRNPLLWSPEMPQLYTLTLTLYQDDIETDWECLQIGYRTVEFDPDRGLIVNGHKEKLKGVCLHHDLGCLGTAFHKDAAKRQLMLMKEMGANAIRTAHNPPAPEVLSLCDALGLMVVNEAFDVWELPKNKFDYSLFFADRMETDVASWIKRDRNHPSVILWSIGNEIYDIHAGEKGYEWTLKLMEEVKKHDPFGNAEITFGSNYLLWEPAQKCADAVGIVGYNYGEKLYDAHHRKYPKRVIYGSETASCVQSRGIYHFPLCTPLLSEDDMQCSSLGNSTTSWGAINPSAVLCRERDTEYSLGQFIWSGIDYLGEPTPYHTKNCYFGQVDTAGFPKDSFYTYKAAWTDAAKEPFVHLYPYWDFNPGQKIDVLIASNLEWVELFWNDISCGKQRIDHQNGDTFLAHRKLKYAPGVLRAVGYDANGSVAAEMTQQSFGDTVSFMATPNAFEWKPEMGELCFVTIQAVDQNGIVVENATDYVHVEVEGPATLLALDNGDSTDFTSYQSHERRLFSGKLMALLRLRQTAGFITIHVTEVPGEKPIRKIELIPERECVLTPQQSTLEIQAIIRPASASFKDIIWRITRENGVESRIAEIEILSDNADKVRVKGLGDGNVRIQALSANGGLLGGKKESEKTVYRVISQLELTLQGFGEKNRSPFAFIQGLDYDESSGNIGMGNEKGFASPREENSYVVYQNLDFTDEGADCVKIPIFELESRPLVLRFWEGVPYGAESRFLGERIYERKSIWNRYQEETFLLDGKLCGVTDFSIELQRKAHIKGFVFEHFSCLKKPIPAKNNNRIYGDSYQVKEDEITGIGNNVSIVFENLDFSGEGAKKIRLCIRGNHAQNTMVLLFETKYESIRYTIEIKYSKEYNVIDNEIKPIRGKGTLTLLFLPGSNMDLKWFAFPEYCE